MLDGVVVSESKAQKDELILEGNDVQNVSQSGMQGSYNCHGLILTPLQRRRSRVSVGYGTRISVNSWTVSTCPTRPLLYSINLTYTPFPLFPPGGGSSLYSLHSKVCMSHVLTTMLSLYDFDHVSTPSFARGNQAG